MDTKKLYTKIKSCLFIVCFSIMNRISYVQIVARKINKKYNLSNMIPSFLKYKKNLMITKIVNLLLIQKTNLHTELLMIYHIINYRKILNQMKNHIHNQMMNHMIFNHVILLLLV